MSNIFWWDISSIFGKNAPQKLVILLLPLSSEIPSFSVHFDSLLKKLLNISSIHDSIFYIVGAVKSKPQNLLLFLPLLTTSFFMGAMVSA